MLETLGGAGDADIFFDEIVVGLDVFVTEGPVFAVAIERSRPEIPIAESQADAAPDVGAATSHSNAPHPIKGLVSGSSVRFFEIVDEPLVRIFVTNAEFDLDGPRLANDFSRAVAVFQFERGLVFGKIFIGLRAASFEKRDLQAGLSEAFAGPAAGCARADNNNVE